MNNKELSAHNDVIGTIFKNTNTRIKQQDRREENENQYRWGDTLVRPLKSESLFSWLLRQSFEFQRTIEDLVMGEREFWLKMKNWDLRSWNNLENWLKTIDVLPLKPELIQGFQMRGLEDPKSLQLQISDYLDLSIKKNRFKRTLKRYYRHELYFCQLCWFGDENRYFRVQWRSNISVMCDEHGIKLLKNCQSCDKYLFENLKGLTLEDLYFCQHCEENIISQNIERSRMENQELAEQQSIIYDNFIQNIIDFRNSQTIFSIPYEWINTQLVDLLENSIATTSILNLELSKLKLRHYYEQNQRLPTVRDPGMERVRSGTSGKEWKRFGISTWNELLDLVFGEVNLEQGMYRGKEGLERAINELRKVYETENRLPTTRDDGMAAIFVGCNENYWIEFGIKSWNDLLRHVFNEVNLEQNYYTGKEGFQRSIELMKEFSETNNRLPTTLDRKMHGILQALKRGRYKEFGFNSWNDLLEHVFGEINHETKIYTGKEGLDRAISELRKFYETHNRLPTTRDDGMASITFAAIDGDYWKDFGIHSWNDLLEHVFGQVNEIKGGWFGKDGLNRAITEFEQFYKKHERLPTTVDKGVRNIRTVIRRGLWEEYGIESWNDLLGHVFGKINFDPKKYIGKYGFETAKNELLEFKENLGRPPVRRDKGMNSIVRAAHEGYWNELGITCWNDVIIRVFGRSNSSSKYEGLEGLERAKNTLRGIYKAKGKLPSMDDAKAIYSAARRKYWREFGILNWNELLMKIFGECNRANYEGRNGLRLAIKKITFYYDNEKDGYSQLEKDERMKKIRQSISDGNWSEFGIESWGDLMTYVTENIE